MPRLDPLGDLVEYVFQEVARRLSGFLVGDRVRGGSISGQIPLASLPPHPILGVKHSDTLSSDVPLPGQVLTYVGTAPSGTWQAGDVAGLSGTHAAATLGPDADLLLGLTGQQLSLDSQDENTFLAGPPTGTASADPTFRGIVARDIGTGAADATKYLRGDLSWQDLAGISGTGVGAHNLLSATHSDSHADDVPADGEVLGWTAGVGWEAKPAGSANLKVEEEDANPSVTPVNTIRVPNGTLTNVGGEIGRAHV